MPSLRGNLHAHTTFSDGRHSVEEVVARYRDLGYDFLAITDHDDRVSEDYWFRLPAGDDRLIVLSGIELDYRPLGQHVGRINGDRETLYVLNHPARYGLEVDDIVNRIRRIRAAGWPIEAMEVTNTGVYQPQHDVGAIAVPKVATDDRRGYTLEVRVSNLGAIDLYESLGFQRRGMRRGYYTDNREDALIMWRDGTPPAGPVAET